MNVFEGTNPIFFVALVIYVSIRKHFMTRQPFAETEVDAVDSKDRALIVLMAITVILLPVLYLLTSLFRFADYDLPILLRCCGMGMIGLSLCLFWRSHADLGVNWSPSLEIRKNHSLVTTGVYVRVRHPMYASIWLWCWGQGLMLPNVLIGWAPTFCFALMYFTRVGREEQLMKERFGAAYEKYMSQTGRLFPKFRLPN